MEALGDLAQSVQALDRIVSLCRSWMDKAKQQGISGEFTRALNEDIITMQDIIIDAQGAVLSAQTTEARLASRITELEQEAMRSKDWEEEKARYVLAEIPHASSPSED